MKIEINPRYGTWDPDRGIDAAGERRPGQDRRAAERADVRRRDASRPA